MGDSRTARTVGDDLKDTFAAKLLLAIVCILAATVYEQPKVFISVYSKLGWGKQR